MSGWVGPVGPVAPPPPPAGPVGPVGPIIKQLQGNFNLLQLSLLLNIIPPFKFNIWKFDKKSNYKYISSIIKLYFNKL